MDALDCEKEIGKRLMTTIIHSDLRVVKFNSLGLLEMKLQSLGFSKIADQSYGPPGGRQLFYKQGRVVVRIKTKGDEKGFRANQPHLSAALTDGNGLDWFNELAKFNYRGELAAKAMTTAENFKPTDFQNNPQRFVVILGGKYDGAGPDAWAQRTHFPFPDNLLSD